MGPSQNLERVARTVQARLDRLDTALAARETNGRLRQAAQRLADTVDELLVLTLSESAEADGLDPAVIGRQVERLDLACTRLEDVFCDVDVDQRTARAVLAAVTACTNLAMEIMASPPPLPAVKVA